MLVEIKVESQWQQKWQIKWGVVGVYSIQHVKVFKLRGRSEFEKIDSANLERLVWL